MINSTSLDVQALEFRISQLLTRIKQLEEDNERLRAMLQSEEEYD